MEQYLAACDLAVTRSGALTVSEIAVSGRASVLIPSPNVTGDHQTYNARALSDKGAAILLPEKKLAEDSSLLLQEIETLRKDKAYREGMASKARSLAPNDAADIIYYSLLT
jgi:UDP-N-acetylglucosamine--N-acetylmuramyl-(pentapeptide) pyrophosphoryl-undecaprenol N-acetylglucosamine transferase